MAKWKYPKTTSSEWCCEKKSVNVLCISLWHHAVPSVTPFRCIPISVVLGTPAGGISAAASRREEVDRLDLLSLGWNFKSDQFFSTQVLGWFKHIRGSYQQIYVEIKTIDTYLFIRGSPHINNIPAYIVMAYWYICPFTYLPIVTIVWTQMWLQLMQPWQASCWCWRWKFYYDACASNWESLQLWCFQKAPCQALWWKVLFTIVHIPQNNTIEGDLSETLHIHTNWVLRTPMSGHYTVLHGEPGWLSHARLVTWTFLFAAALMIMGLRLWKWNNGLSYFLVIWCLASIFNDWLYCFFWWATFHQRIHLF